MINISNIAESVRRWFEIVKSQDVV